ncbi:PilZ domain-containing protein [Isoalcanivorax indicus]|uniref:PilZ domain-containing protein n=1 Tax=Isoalcanivorax indicus TaxID=2202653 RepID=UPI0013C525AA|nr:PilZ domain-containing protein [Isoalcanivorax indicus]
MHQRLHRDHLKVNVRVLERDSGRVLGHLVDLSLGGLCVSGESPACEGDPVWLTLNLPWPIDGQRQVSVAASLRWQRDAGRRRHAGYRLHAADAPALAVLDALAARFAD